MLKFKNHYETEEFASDAKITIGCLYSGTRISSINLFRGGYVHIARSRFKIRKYLNSDTFKEQIGPCRLYSLIRVDKSIHKWTKPRISVKSYWKPID